MAQHSEQEHKHPTPGLYLLILAALVVGTCLTWGIAFVDLGIFNPVVRKQAIFWLGQSKDPRALDFLEEILTK